MKETEEKLKEEIKEIERQLSGLSDDDYSVEGLCVEVGRLRRAQLLGYQQGRKEAENSLHNKSRKLCFEEGKHQATTQTLTQVQEIIDKWFKENSQIAEEQECKDLGITRNGIINNLDMEELKSQISKLKHSQQEQMGDKGYTMSSPSSVAKKSEYTGMSESNQKHTPAETNTKLKQKQEKAE